MKSRLFLSLTYFLSFLLTSFGAFASRPAKSGLQGLGREHLNYVVTYKWGLIQKDAGTADMYLTESPAQYTVKMTAKSKPWADKIFMVRDTLLTVIDKNGFKVKLYEKTAHEGGKYNLDVVKFEHKGPKVIGHAHRVKDNGKQRTESDVELEAQGTAFDMLSVFYYLRTLDFAQIASGQPLVYTLFSGSKAETLTVKKIGREKVKMRNGKEVEAMHVTFKFTQSGKKKSSDDIDCWLSVDGRNVPLLIVGKLPIGQIRCHLTSVS